MASRPQDGRRLLDAHALTTDLVLEGGGVKGAGPRRRGRSVLAEEYDFHRVAGTSAGAIVAAFVAAGLTAGSSG